jgi:dTDP-4-amino-4,6-dideoxygalactose transaminase
MKSLDYIPVANPHAQFLSYEREIRTAIDRVLVSGNYILGPEVEAFELEFAEFMSLPYCVAVANGTDALALSLIACGVSPGDEVITVANTAVATVAAIEQIGAIPVFVDIDPATRCMDPNKIAPAITAKTRAVLPVHLYGHPAAMPDICKIAQRHNLHVVEDCAQAHGASIDGNKVGSFGDVAAFSFYPTKNLGALGDAGAVVTRHESTFRRLHQLRQYGWDQNRESQIAGINSRMDEIQAAILRVKLTGLESELSRRRLIADRFCAAIGDGPLIPPPIPTNGELAVHLFVVESNDRSAFQSFCESEGIGSAIHYPVPIHLHRAYQNRLRISADLYQTERLSKRIVSLPLYPQLTDLQVSHICQALNKWENH